MSGCRMPLKAFLCTNWIFQRKSHSSVLVWSCIPFYCCFAVENNKMIHCAAHWRHTVWILLMHSFMGWTQSCQLLDNTLVVSGQFCPVKGVVAYIWQRHLCKALCIQSPSCGAYNYNTSDGTCTRLATPCAVLYGNVLMEFGALDVGLIRGGSTQDCCEWIIFTAGDPRDERMVTTEASHRIVARIKKDGRYYFGYHNEMHDRCYTTNGNDQLTNRHDTCERLRIVDGCIARWTPYTTGEPLPSNVVIGGENTNGKNIYVTIFNNLGGSSISGYFTEGAIAPYVDALTSTTMKLLALMWWKWTMKWLWKTKHVALCELEQLIKVNGFVVYIFPGVNANL